MIVRGVAASGLSKATSFTQIAWVASQLEEKLGIRPYPGTFNVLLVSADELARWDVLKSTSGIPLDEPGANSCTAVCYAVLVNDRVRGAILIPKVPGYPRDQVEIVAPGSIRRELNLTDGDPIALRVLEPDAPRV